MRFLKRNTPDLPDDVVAAALADHYGLFGDLKALESERDQNFLVDTSSGRFLFKVCNIGEDPAVIDLQIQALHHVARVDPSLPVPRALPSSSGKDIAHVGHEGVEHTVRLMSFLNGEVANNRQFDTAAFRRHTGSTLAQLDLALRGFFHPAANQDHPWDVKRASRLLEHVRHVPNASVRAILTSIMERARDQVIPACAALRHQVIHQDAHTSNLVVAESAPDRVAGVIDFGDMVHGPMIVELAVAAHLSGRPDPSPMGVVDIVLGYDSVTPLELEEVELLYDLALIRMAMGSLIPAARRVLHPEEDAYEGSPEERWGRIERAVDVAHEVKRALMDALGFRRPRGTSELGVARAERLGRYSPHFYKDPLHVVSAQGITISGADGREYLDFYNNVPTVGHNHPRVVNAIARQQERLNTNTRYLYEPVVEYAESLTATLGHDLDVCLFVNSGSEANDVASQIVRHRSGGTGFVIMAGAYHGMTVASSELTDSGALPDHVTRLAIEGNPVATARGAVSTLAKAGHQLAGFIVDPAMTSSGIPDLPHGYLGSISDVMRESGGLVVADEVQAGFGRTGVMWGHEREGFAPDIVTIGKPAGNGHPLGVVVTRKDILDDFMADHRLFSTFGGNPVSCAAGMAVLRVIADERLVANSARVGRYMKESLLALEHPRVVHVRGSGLLIGLEMAVDDLSGFTEKMREQQVLVGAAGGLTKTLKLRPPLVATNADVDRFLGALVACLDD